MVERIKAWHEEFIQGINWRMLGIAAAGLISASFFIRGKFDDIMNYQVETRRIDDSNYTRLDNKMENLKFEFTRKVDVTRDSLQHEIERLSTKINTNGKIVYVTETKKDAKVTTHPYGN